MGIKHEEPTSTDNILTDLIGETEAQQQEDGRHITPRDSVSARERKRNLTRAWKGTPLAACVIDAEAGADINRHGVYEDDGHGNLELLKFASTRGYVHSVSPVNGGYIELSGGTCISLHVNNGDDVSVQGYGLGLEIEVLPADIQVSDEVVAFPAQARAL